MSRFLPSAALPSAAVLPSAARRPVPADLPPNLPPRQPAPHSDAYTLPAGLWDVVVPAGFWDVVLPAGFWDVLKLLSKNKRASRSRAKTGFPLFSKVLIS